MSAPDFRAGQRVYLVSAPGVIGAVAAPGDIAGTGGLTCWPEAGPDKVPVRWPGYDWWEDPEFLRHPSR